jgi:WD40 repeat protein
MAPSKLPVLLLLPLAVLGTTLAQQVASQDGTCAMPVFSIANEPNMLSEQQEEWVGDILDPQVRVAFHTIDDPGGSYLDELGQRLLAQLPESKIHYRFTVVDLPENDSFGIPGGRIYISRKIIALAQNEDELAGLLGHEIGHIITRQAAIDLTREFQNVLGISQLGDRKDIVDQWNKLLDTVATKPDALAKKRREEEQLIADRVALYAMARAGYQPSRFVDFFDRLAETKGNKGSFWTNLFGRTTSDAKRLRELARTATLSQNCVNAAPAPLAAGFEQWRKGVMAARFSAAKEELPGLMTRTALKPRLRSDLRLLRFSPDGQYLLAQDDSSIYLLTASPVTHLFTIDAPDSYLAQFTPDSAGVVFYDKELRVEKWAIAGAQRISVHQPALAAPCLQASLSHSGEMLACVTAEGQVELVDVASNAPVMSTRKIHSASNLDMAFSFLLSVGDVDAGSIFNVLFSPDDRYFMVANRESALAYDLRTRSEVNLPRSIRDIAGVSCAFLGPDTMAGFSYQRPGQTLVRLKFPSGEVMDQHLERRIGKLRPPDKGDYLLLETRGDNAVSLVNLSDARTMIAYKKIAFAVYGDVYAGETGSGELGVYSLSDKKYLSGIDLPDSPLNAARAIAISADGKWLAVSGRSRGAIWKLESGERAMITWNFDGAFFEQDQLMAKCPKPTGQSPGVFKFDTSTQKVQALYPLPVTANLALEPFVFYFQTRTWQLGDLLVRVTPELVKNRFMNRFLMEVSDVRTNRKLWERVFEKQRPEFFYSQSGKTLTMVVANYEAMKIEAARDPKLGAQLNALSDASRRKDAYIVLVVEAATGKNLGSILVDTGKLSFKVRDAFSTGETVIVTDSDQRSLIYSLQTGEQKGKVFGFTRALSDDGKSLLVSRGRNDLVRYDAVTLQSSAPLSFPSPVGYTEFSSDGRSIYVVTYDQTVYSLKTPPVEQQNADAH